LSPSSMSEELIPIAGTDRLAGGDAGSTGPIDPARVWVGPGACMRDAAGSGGASVCVGVGCIRAGELPAATVGAGPASAAAGKDPREVADVEGWGAMGGGPESVPQAATPKSRAAVIALQVGESLRSARSARPKRPQSVRASRAITLLHVTSGLSSEAAQTRSHKPGPGGTPTRDG